MRKSSAIFVSAIALGLVMFVPLKASAQGVSIYIDPGYPGYGGGYPAYHPPYPSYGYAYPSYGYA
jgi:integrase